MEHKANPVRRTGIRNIHCPFYSDCLDYVVHQIWRSWICSDCQYQNLKDPNDGPELFAEFSFEYAGIPDSVMREVERTV